MKRERISEPLITPVFRDFTAESAAEIIDIALRRAALVGDMRTALEAGDKDRALELAREVAGLEVVKQ